MDLSTLKYGDVLEGDRGDRWMVVRGMENRLNIEAICLQPDDSSDVYRPSTFDVGEVHTIYRTWSLKLLETA